MKIEISMKPMLTTIRISKSNDIETIIASQLAALKVKEELNYQSETKKSITFTVAKKLSNKSRIELEKRICLAIGKDYAAMIQSKRLVTLKTEKKEVVTKVINGYSGCPISGFDFKFKYV